MAKKCSLRDYDDWCSNQNCYCNQDDSDCPDCTNVDFCGNFIEH